MSKTKSHEEFIEDIKLKNVHYNDIEVIGKYVGVKTPIECKCKIHTDYTWFPTPDSLLSGFGCKLCGIENSTKYRTKDNKQFLEDFKLKNKHYNDIEIIGEYVNSKMPIECRCKIHTDYTWFANPSSLLAGRGCKLCGTNYTNKLNTKDNEQFIKDFKLKNKHFNNIEIIDEYVGASKPIMCRCKIHDYIWNPSPDNLLQGTGCPVCSNRIVIIGINDMWTTNKNQARLLANPEDGYKYVETSQTRVDWKCPDCGNIIKNKKIYDINRRRLSCPICSDGVSYPQKLMGNVLKELNVDFETEQYFNWCVFDLNGKDYHARYDFVFEYNNQKYIVEADGSLGHGEEPHCKCIYTKEELIYIDRMKDKLAKENRYKLIRIDCKQSELEYIKTSILNSELANIFDLYYIDWEECHKNSLKSKIIEACNLWNSGIKSTSEIGKILKVSVSSIISYLKRGKKANLCDYDSKKSIVRSREFINWDNVCKSVVCLNTDMIFKSISEAGRYYNINKCAINNCCLGKSKYSGENLETGEKLVWVYYQDYICMTPDDINAKKYHDNPKQGKQIVCITTCQKFNSLAEAGRFYNINIGNIGLCVLGKRNFCGKHPITKKELKWQVYDEEKHKDFTSIR